MLDRNNAYDLGHMGPYLLINVVSKWSTWCLILLLLLFAAPIPADAEQHRGGAQLDHHLPHAHEHYGPLPKQSKGQGGETVLEINQCIQSVKSL